MINKSDQISNLAAALLKAQKEIGYAAKGAENPFYHSTYADLSSVIQSVKDPLNNNGITFLQAVDGSDVEGSPVVDTILLHESGQYISTRTPVYCNKPNDPQAFGSGITYAKRYALQALMGLPTADDDGEAAMARNAKKTKTKTEKPQPKPEEDITKIIEQVFFNFTTEHANEPTQGFIFDATKFKEGLRKLYGKLPKAKKDACHTIEAFSELSQKIKVDECLVEGPNG